jgi:putative tryptophan/tyrosine transport system substrate-binding protein
MAPDISRRELMSTLGCAAAAWPLSARAQQTARLPQIGVLYPGIAAALATRLPSLREGLRAVGYRDAEGVEIVSRMSEGDPSRLPALAADLVERKVDILVPISPSAVRAAKSATATIPIVANDLESDPVKSGFVASFAHPGGNITGLFSDFPDFGTKWVELMKEVIPSLSSAIVFWDPATGPVQLGAVEAAGRVLNIKLEVMEIRAVG